MKPLFVTSGGVEIVDSDDLNVFFQGHVQGIGQLLERAERIRRMEVSVDVHLHSAMVTKFAHRFRF